MDRISHSLALPLFLGLAVLVIAAHNFERYYVTKTYPLHVFTACDPAEHDCFVADPDVADLGFQSGPYEKVEVIAADAPTCLEEHTCSSFTCDGAAYECTISYCSPDTLEDGESCSSGNP